MKNGLEILVGKMKKIKKSYTYLSIERFWWAGKLREARILRLCMGLGLFWPLIVMGDENERRYENGVFDSRVDQRYSWLWVISGINKKISSFEEILFKQIWEKKKKKQNNRLGERLTVRDLIWCEMASCVRPPFRLLYPRWVYEPGPHLASSRTVARGLSFFPPNFFFFFYPFCGQHPLSTGHWGHLYSKNIRSDLILIESILSSRIRGKITLWIFHSFRISIANPETEFFTQEIDYSRYLLANEDNKLLVIWLIRKYSPESRDYLYHCWNQTMKSLLNRTKTYKITEKRCESIFDHPKFI